jgi:glutathione peroxidase
MNIRHIRRASSALLVLVLGGSIAIFARFSAERSSASAGNKKFTHSEITTQKKEDTTMKTNAATSVYDFTMQDIDGKSVPLSEYKGKVALIVNVASKCGYTPQYEGLEALYKRFKDKGFVVLGFPANNFMGQEPGTNAEIKEFCSLKYNVTFPMFAKISVKGADIHPLYEYLTKNANPAGDVQWNFNKFLIGKDGAIIARYASGVKPESAEIIAAIEKAL